MNSQCRFADCEEKPGLFGKPGKCKSCGEMYCPRHLCDGDYARFVTEKLARPFPEGKGFCIDCVRRDQPQHVKGTIDKKCTRADCLASLSSVTTSKRLCSYCGRLFCGKHFLTRDELTTELLSNLKKFKVIDGQGACEECLRKDPTGALIMGSRGSFQKMGAAISEGFAAQIQASLPGIAHQAGHSLAQGTVTGIREREKDIAEVTQKAMDAPVKQRIWATVIALIGAQIAALGALLFGKLGGGKTFLTSYRWILFGVVVLLFVVGFTTSLVRLRRMWKAIDKAGALGAVGKNAARSAFFRSALINVPAMLLILGLTIASGWLFMTQK